MSYICTRALHSLVSFVHRRAASIVIPQLPKAIFTTFFKPNFGVLALHLLPPSTPFWPYGTHPFFPLIRTSSFLTLFIRHTSTELLKHFISKTVTFILSALLIPHASAPYNAVCSITLSYRYCLAFILNLPVLLSTLFIAPHALYP